jgi:hypothetical protein
LAVKKVDDMPFSVIRKYAIINMVAGTTTKQKKRYAGRSGCKMMESQVSHPTTELIAFHRRKRIFLSLAEMEQEDPDQIQICEFRGQNFDLVAD